MEKRDKVLIYTNANIAKIRSPNLNTVKIGVPRVGLRGSYIIVEDLFENLTVDEAIAYFKFCILHSALPDSEILMKSYDLMRLVNEIENKKNNTSS